MREVVTHLCEDEARRRSASGRECQYSPKVVHRNAHSHARANLDYLLADHDI